MVQHISLSPQQGSQPNFPAWLVQAGQPHPGGVFLGQCRQTEPHSSRVLWGTEELSCSPTASLGSCRELLTPSQVSSPPSSPGQGCGLNPSHQTPAWGKADAAQPSSPSPSRDGFTATKPLSRAGFGVSRLPAPPAERSQGAAVQGFRFRPISQKFCHHAAHHAHSRIRITQSMARLQPLLKSVEKPSLATMGAGSVRSDRYHRVVLIWGYLFGPQSFSWKGTGQGVCRAGVLPRKAPDLANRLSMSI